MLNGDNSPVTEEYKKLKSMIVKLTRKDRFMNTIMVTSSVRAEGKSLTSLNLAISLAQEYDHTVLLVDADMRKPSVHEYLGIPLSAGLSDCLTKDKKVEECLIRTGIGKLSILPAGTIQKNPVELVMSSKMRDLLAELKQRYADRYVIFDTPPLLPFAEVHSLSSLVDGVLFVIREGHTPLSSIKGGLDILKEANLLGCVYNCASVERFNGYHHYYGYGDYYGSKDGKRG